MDLKTFFEQFILEHEIIRANIINVTSFSDKDEFIDFKMAELNDETAMEDMVKHLSVTETKLIKRLYGEEAANHLHKVNYDVELYDTLIDYQYILEDATNAGVIHEDIVSRLYEMLTKTGIVPTGDMYVSDEAQSGRIQPGQLQNIYTGPVYWFYDNLKFHELRRILTKLNIKPEGSYKEDYIKQLIPLLTDKNFLKRALAYIGDNEYDIIHNNVQDNQHIYDKKSRWAAAKKIGLLVEVHRDYLVMHDEVMGALKDIDFKSFKKERKDVKQPHVEDYNAYHLVFSIHGMNEDIVREVYVPTGMNFYELETIIKEVMGWRTGTESYFETDDMIIYSNRLEAGGHMLEDKASMTASYAQIDAVIDTSVFLIYEYNPDAGYKVDITLKRHANIDRQVPEITHYSGPIPIDNIGGIRQLPTVLEILSQSDHQEHIPIFQKVHRLNYRERYPVSATNKRLREIFKKSYPLTEFNDTE